MFCFYEFTKNKGKRGREWPLNVARPIKATVSLSGRQLKVYDSYVTFTIEPLTTLLSKQRHCELSWPV